MGLFTKKGPCAICGGKVKGLFPRSIDDQYICDDCYGNVDLPNGATNNMTLEDFRAYMAFRDENQQLKEKFQITQKVDLGWLNTKIVFDMNNRLLCMNKKLETTVFEGSQVKSFIIKEDSVPLLEGSAAGLRRYVSAVPTRAMAMEPQITMYRMQLQAQRAQGTADKQPDIRFDIPEPFQNFNVEIRFEHPYWDVFQADMKGPTFNNSDPDINCYLDEYHRDAATMEELAQALMQIAFPGASEQSTATAAGVMTAAAPAAAPVDAVAEIQKFKALMDQGVITEEEFAAKKRQLLGI